MELKRSNKSMSRSASNVDSAVETVVKKRPFWKRGKDKEESLKEREKTKKSFDFASNELLMNTKPVEGYVFHSDYFEVDDQVATILSFFHVDGATDNFGPFWGINKIPSGLDDKVDVVVLEHVSRLSEGWIQGHQTRAEGIASMDTQEMNRAGTTRGRHNASRKTTDLETVSRELQDGASYLNVKYRLLVKAPDLETLDAALVAIERLYMERFGTFSAAAYAGEQRSELSNFFRVSDRKIGRGFYMTSTEYAGSYSLVTHGMEDPAGEYVGYMVGDVNNSAVLFDVDNYRHHTVVVNEHYHEKLGRVHISDMWGSKISQSALLNNHKVVHILMDECDLDKLGPKFESLTYKVDMHQGAVNMFEMFGEEEDEMSVFPAQMQKLILMAEQAYETTDSDRSVIRGSLEEVATKFYIDRRMWVANAKEHRDQVRVVGIPHEQVPRLREFVSYLATGKKQQLMAVAQDTERVHALTILELTFRNMLQNNGDLFDVITTEKIDGAKYGQRVIYDFGGLMRRGKGVAMAQLVNIIGFAVGNLGLGDTVILHGVDLIDDNVKPYINEQFAQLFAKGGRVVYLYNNTDAMLRDKSFCQFDKADYTIFGNMTDTTVVDYQRSLGQDIPPDLSRLITSKSDLVCYIRRGFDNVVFCQDLALGISTTGPKLIDKLKKKKKGKAVIK